MKILQSNKSNFNEARLIDAPALTVKESQIRLKIERFSFTANNITYAVLGDYLKYWAFFPAVDAHGNDASAQWGEIPVWGFASVVESHNDAINVGDRYFGYFPPAEECVMTPTKISDMGFIDGAEHRASLPAGYNIYRSAPNSEADSASTLYQADNERSMLYPLFVTAYCIHDMLASRAWRHAEQVLIISASSKTSIGVAYAMHSDDKAPMSIGLTSERNLAKVNGLDLYDAVHSYDKVAQLDSSKATVIIDMSGNKALLAQLHQHFEDNMKLTLNVGITHWNDLEEIEGINAERSEQFFAPSQIQEIIKRIGPEAFDEQSSKFIKDSAFKTRSWLQIKELTDLQELVWVYPDVCAGSIDADIGLMVVLN